MSGLATEWDLDALEAELASRQGELDEQHRKQTSLPYTLGFPEKEEVRDAKGLLKKLFGRRS